MFDTISESVAAYDEFIREVSGDVDLLGVNYDPATILNAIDPIAYKCGWIDYMDSLDVDTDELEDDYTFDRDRM